MPIDDHRSRTPARPVIDEADDDIEGRHPPGEPNPTPERLAEIEAAWVAEALKDLEEFRAGRLQGVPWEEVRATLFDPPTAEEVARQQVSTDTRSDLGPSPRSFHEHDERLREGSIEACSDQGTL